MSGLNARNDIFRTINLFIWWWWCVLIIRKIVLKHKGNEHMLLMNHVICRYTEWAIMPEIQSKGYFPSPRNDNGKTLKHHLYRPPCIHIILLFNDVNIHFYHYSEFNNHYREWYNWVQYCVSECNNIVPCMSFKYSLIR